QPAVLTVDLALTRLLAEYGITPDMVMGHSLGEYGALVAAGVLTFDNALKAVSARGTEMTKVSVEDNGLMAAVFAPLNEIEKIVNRVDGYVEIANINSYSQSVIGGATEAVKKAVLAIKEAGYDARMLPVSHAFHTKIVAPASKPLGRVLAQMDLQSPNIPIVANVTGEFYPMGPGVVPEMLDLLSRQVESPVQFIKGLKTLYKNGARVFVEVGPKKALHGFVEDVLGQNDDVLALFTNHPKTGDLVSFNQALCGLYAAGLGAAETAKEMEQVTAAINMPSRTQPASAPMAQTVSGQSLTRETAADSQTEADKYLELGHLFGEFLERGFQIYSRGKSSPQSRPQKVWITGAAMGLPGTDRVFDDANVERIFSGQQFIDLVPPKLRELMVDKNITRVVKSADGSGSFETIHSADEVIKLAARAVNLDIHRDFGFPEDRIAALDTVTALAIGAGIDAMRDAGIPLLLHYKTTTKGTKLPEKWQLPDEMRDDTGIIFTSAFPGYDSFAGEMERYFVNRALRQRLNDLQELRKRFTQINPSGNGVLDEIDRKIELLNTEMEKHPYVFERRFLFKVLSMGHSQFAEYIGARGPNTQINSACASFTTAVGLANDWIQAGRCRRVIIISADNITSDRLMDWFGAGFLASGAAATDEDVKEVAIPFDRRRHGMIIGMGSAAIVVENTDSAKERGLQPIAEVLSTITANSAFHGTRLDVNHISQVMEKLISEAEAKWGINRYEIAPQTVFVSHETYTPARGGSAAAEVNALRHVFGASANRIVIANTKGFTGHPMGVGIEDVVGIKAIETGIVPPVANFKEVDPELGPLNLSTGGHYPVEYALRLGAGFGSQISMMLIRRVPTKDGIRRKPSQLGYAYRIADQKVWQEWLDRVTGYRGAELEVEKRTLRVKDQGPASPRVKRPEAALQKIPSPPEEPVVSQPVPGTEESTKVAAANVPEVGETATADTTAKIAAVETSLDPVREKVLQLISEQTGYPPDMLEMDLDLEADLGIDTVKQAEMFAAVREAYDIPREDSLQLRDFPTLAHVIQFVYDRRPDLKPAARPSPAEGSQAGTPPGESTPVVETPSAPSPEVSGEDPVKAKVLELIAEKTGYPPDMLDLDLDLEADLGIDTVKQAEMFAAVREAYDI
ncbi:MAG: acyltransferase domain-containing protein, partial [Calditrichia bacterium]